MKAYRVRGGKTSRFGRVIPGGKNLRYVILMTDPRGVLDGEEKNPNAGVRNTTARLVMRHFTGYRHVVYHISGVYSLLQILTICKMFHVVFVGHNEI
jgi:hypothetical protein